MIVLIGASASGKTQIAKKLVETFGFKKLVTTTTREKRPNEINGVDYHFITVLDFKDLITKNSFVEYVKYDTNFYGINKKDVDDDKVVVVEIRGANELITQNKNNVFIVYIESSEEIRIERMIFRGDSVKQIKDRLKTDNELFNVNELRRIDLHIINENRSLDDIAKFITIKYKEYQEKKTL